jgi:hypothetical protein
MRLRCDCGESAGIAYQILDCTRQAIWIGTANLATDPLVDQVTQDRHSCGHHRDTRCKSLENCFGKTLRSAGGKAEHVHLGQGFYDSRLWDFAMKAYRILHTEGSAHLFEPGTLTAVPKDVQRSNYSTLAQFRDRLNHNVRVFSALKTHRDNKFHGKMRSPRMSRLQLPNPFAR